MKSTHAQIIATIGPASESYETFKSMAEHGLNVVRFNFSWGTLEERGKQIKTIRQVATELDKRIPIMIDLPCNRIQEGTTHTYDANAESPLTPQDETFIEFGVQQGIEYFALSFVGVAHDVTLCREMIAKYGGTQKIIAKIERQVAIDNIAEIIEVADAIMIARGDLGSELPLEDIPYAQKMIIEACKKAGKPVITATQMMLSMEKNPAPTRAEVSDVTAAILTGSDAVMLSEETTQGAYPVNVIDIMHKIVLKAEKHMAGGDHTNHL